MISENALQNENNIGKWDSWYKELPSQPSAFRYSDTISYQLAAQFLEDCACVEDWGCGAGGFMRYRPNAIGVDGSDTKFAKKKYIDLSKYTSVVDGINLRHVLEHNYKWEKILKNALQSAIQKLVITLFVPLGSNTREISHNLPFGVDVPDLQLSITDFLKIVYASNPIEVFYRKFESETGYKSEEMFFIRFK